MAPNILATNETSAQVERLADIVGNNFSTLNERDKQLLTNIIILFVYGTEYDVSLWTCGEESSDDYPVTFNELDVLSVTKKEMERVGAKSSQHEIWLSKYSLFARLLSNRDILLNKNKNLKFALDRLMLGAASIDQEKRC